MVRIPPLRTAPGEAAEAVGIAAEAVAGIAAEVGAAGVAVEAVVAAGPTGANHSRLP